MKKILSGVVIGALITAFFFIYFRLIFFRPSPGPDPEPVIVTVKEPVYISDISGQVTIPDQPASPEGTYSPDFKVSVPVTGEFITENAEVKITGETVVERIGDLLKVDTKFYDAEVSIKYKPPPEPEKKLWSIGAYVVTDFDSIRPGGFIQRDFPVFEFSRVDVAAFGRVEMDIDTRIMAGIQFSF